MSDFDVGGDWSRSWMRIFKKHESVNIEFVAQHVLCCYVFFLARCPAWDSSHNSNLTGDLQFQYARYVINLLTTTHE